VVACRTVCKGWNWKNIMMHVLSIYAKYTSTVRINRLNNCLFHFCSNGRHITMCMLVITMIVLALILSLTMLYTKHEGIINHMKTRSLGQEWNKQYSLLFSNPSTRFQFTFTFGRNEHQNWNLHAQISLYTENVMPKTVACMHATCVQRESYCVNTLSYISVLNNMKFSI
jgi:hypothetical protein